MALDPVPWLIGNEAEHSPEVARTLAFVASGGNEGVASPGDMKVRALTVPGNKVIIGPGACSFLNRSAGAGGSQSYTGRGYSDTETDTFTATGAGGGRSDLVVVRSTDSQYDPWPVRPPGDERRFGPYFEPFVIEGVPGTTRRFDQLGLGYSALALARVDLPASTSNITDGYIVDLRKLIHPRETSKYLHSVGFTEHDLTSASYVTWPNWQPTIDIPIWATKCTINVNIMMVAQIGSTTAGELRVRLGSLTGPTTVVYSFDATGGSERVVVSVADTFSGSSFLALRGTTQAIKVEGLRYAAHTGFLRMYTGTQVSFDVRYHEDII